MFEKEKATEQYIKMGEGIESRTASPKELENLLTPLKETLSTSLQIVASEKRAASDIESLMNHPNLIALRPKETSRKNGINILYFGAEDLISQLQTLAECSEDESLLKPANQLLIDIRAANPLYQVQTRLKVMERLLPEVSLRNTAFQQLVDPTLTGHEKYSSIFILRPFNLSDNLITDLGKIVNEHPNDLKLPINSTTQS